MLEWGEIDEEKDGEGNVIFRKEPCVEERDAVAKLTRVDYDEIDSYSFVATFKIYADTTFDGLK